MLQLDKISKDYPFGSKTIRALHRVSMTIEVNERVAVLGKSGGGKSTLLNLVAGLDRPTSGEVYFEGQPLSRWTPKQLADYRRHSVGMVFQSFQLIHNRTALQNIELPLIFAGVHRQERRARAQEMLTRVGLHDRARHRPSQLSGGQQQRVAIARALISRPRLLVADEPTGNLDTGTSQAIIELLCRIAQEDGMAFLLVTHDWELANSIADRVVQVSDGQVSEE